MFVNFLLTLKSACMGTLEKMQNFYLFKGTCDNGMAIYIDTYQKVISNRLTRSDECKLEQSQYHLDNFHTNGTSIGQFFNIDPFFNKTETHKLQDNSTDQNKSVFYKTLTIDPNKFQVFCEHFFDYNRIKEFVEATTQFPQKFVNLLSACNFFSQEEAESSNIFKVNCDHGTIYTDLNEITTSNELTDQCEIREIFEYRLGITEVESEPQIIDNSLNNPDIEPRDRFSKIINITKYEIDSLCKDFLNYFDYSSENDSEASEQLNELPTNSTNIYTNNTQIFEENYRHNITARSIEDFSDSGLPWVYIGAGTAAIVGVLGIGYYSYKKFSSCNKFMRGKWSKESEIIDASGDIEGNPVDVSGNIGHPLDDLS